MFVLTYVIPRTISYKMSDGRAPPLRHPAILSLKTDAQLQGVCTYLDLIDSHTLIMNKVGSVTNTDLSDHSATDKRHARRSTPGRSRKRSLLAYSFISTTRLAHV